MLKTAYVGLMRAAAGPLRASGLLARMQGAPKDSLGFWLGSQFAIYDTVTLARMKLTMRRCRGLAPTWPYSPETTLVGALPQETT